MDYGYWDRQRVLVTGCAGFVGRWVCRELATTQASLFLTDRSLPEPDELFIETPSNDAEGFELDLGDPDGLLEALREYEPSVILNLAGESGVCESTDDPEAAFRANAAITNVLLNAARVYNDETPAQLEALVHVSSSDVYGLQAAAPTPESSPLNGRSVHAATKACGDVLTRAYADAYGLPATVARVASSFGGDDPHQDHLVTYAIRCALTGETPVIRGSGRDARGFMHVDDTVHGILMLAQRTAEDAEIAGSAFNIAPDEPITVIELVRKVLRRAGRPDIEPVVSTPSAEPTVEHLDNTAARRLLGFSPVLTLDDALDEAITWYASQVRAMAA